MFNNKDELSVIGKLDSVAKEDVLVLECLLPSEFSQSKHRKFSVINFKARGLNCG